MLKHLMNGGSLLSYAVYDAESEAKAAKDAQRASLMKNNTVGATAAVPVSEAGETEAEEEEDGEESDEDGDEGEGDPDPVPEADPDENLTEEEKAEAAAKKAAAEKQAAKAQRKQDRMQRRIDEAIAQAKSAKEELAAFKTANPDSKLSEEEVEARAEAKAAEKLAAKNLEEVQAEFNKTCENLQKAATKIDPEFYEKITDIADQFGPIPSFMIGALDDLENGAAVLAHITNDDELAEKIWNLKTKPAKMTLELVKLSNQLLDDKKKKEKKQISKVPEPTTKVQGSRSVSTTITSADTKPENMDNYVAKRRAQMEERRKVTGGR